MSAKFRALFKLSTARLSRRIVWWVFASIVVIEIIILVPSTWRRERELLSQIKQKSYTAIEVLLRALPPDYSHQQLFDALKTLEEDPLIVGGVLSTHAGEPIGDFGKLPTPEVASGNTISSYDGSYYDVAIPMTWQGNQYIFALCYDASSVRDEVNAFIWRIAGLVLIISIFVTVATIIALEPTVITPILKLRDDLLRAGKAASHDEPMPQFSSTDRKSDDELNDVILAFQTMAQQVFDAIAERKASEAQLKQLNEQVAQANGEIQILNARLQAENEHLNEVDRIKTNFISTVSHELRTPLTSVLGFAKLIQKKLDTTIFPVLDTNEKKINRAVQQVGSNINIIVSEGQRLTDLINDVLDIAKMEAGKVEWKKESIAIADVIDRSIAATASLWESKQLDLITTIEPNLPTIIGDHDRLVQVVINLISNAVKFTETGSITCVAKQHIDQENHYILVSVIDTGIGIAPENQPKVFEQFKQIGDTLTNKPKGTGLGLPICKQIIDYHGGDIWVDSELGQGSAFRFTLPISKVRSLNLQTLSLSDLLQRLQGQTSQILTQTISTTPLILVVDDDPNIRELLHQELKNAGYNVRQAQDGLEAVHYAKQSHPNLIIMDVMMPKMNGIDAASVLKNDPVTRDIPIIILSSVEALGTSYSVEIDAYLNKPIEVNNLLVEIDTVLEQNKGSKRVLIIERDETVLDVLANILQSRGYNVNQLESGDELLPTLTTLQPNLIIAKTSFWHAIDETMIAHLSQYTNALMFLALDCENSPSTASSSTASPPLDAQT